MDSPDFIRLKKLGKEFLDLLPSSDSEQADNGFKCFAIEYINADLSEHEAFQASILVEILSKKLFEHEINLWGMV